MACEDTNSSDFLEILQLQLDEIVISQIITTNEYLKDLEITITTTSPNIGDICDAIISQINEKIQSIKSGEE